ncbi:PIN domain-like protein [Xylariaceae sp. FL1272]|nr:PIN domain-like protein [Xylariaceae sp. FL1272]
MSPILTPRAITSEFEDFSLAETGAGELISLAECSSEHFIRTGKPFRIAVAEKTWWLKELSASVEDIIKKEFPNSQARETLIMKRLLYLLSINVQLIFVSDGPDKPEKKVWALDRSYDEEFVAPLRRLLDHLGVPHHKAPGEAEAECARLQILGVVDAVWADDWTALTFGATTMIDFDEPEGRDYVAGRDLDYVVIYRTKSMKMSQLDFLMHDIIVGSDYSDGVIGCDWDWEYFAQIKDHWRFTSAKRALEMAVAGQPPNVWTPRFRDDLQEMVRITLPDCEFLELGDDFPLADLQACTQLNVSPNDVLLDLPCLRQGWVRPYGPNMRTRYQFFKHNFSPANNTSQTFSAWLAQALVPIELYNKIRDTQDGDGQIKSRRDDGLTLLSQGETLTKIDCEVWTVIPELLSIAESLGEGRAVKPERIDVNLLSCVVRCGLPEGCVLYSPKTESGGKEKNLKRGYEGIDRANHPPRKRPNLTQDVENHETTSASLQPAGPKQEPSFTESSDGTGGRHEGPVLGQYPVTFTMPLRPKLNPTSTETSNGARTEDHRPVRRQLSHTLPFRPRRDE